MVVAVIAVLALSGGSGPEAAVRAFYDAVKAGDCETMWNMLADKPQIPGGEEQIKGRVCSALERGRADLPEITDVTLLEETETTAVVEVTGTSSDGDTDTQRLPLSKVDGEWKLDPGGLAGSASSSGG
ncbi:MAG TPA: DUF4878 domain-containing protein [Actinopolymorphaceae bacterium]